MTLHEEMQIAVRNTMLDLCHGYPKDRCHGFLTIIEEVRVEYVWPHLHPRTIEKEIWGPIRINNLAIHQLTLSMASVFASNLEDPTLFVEKLIKTIVPYKGNGNGIIDDELNKRTVSNNDLYEIFSNNMWLVMIYCFCQSATTVNEIMDVYVS